MTETKRLYPTTQGKIIQLDYDFITSLAGACCYCLTDAQVEMILGIVDYYAWSTRWFSANNLVDQQTITDLQGGLVEALMNGCCGDSAPLIFRYGADGVYEVSTDGGVTWTPAPQYDPRNTSLTWPNPNDMGVDNTKCQAANSVVEQIKAGIVQNLNDTMTAADIVAVVAAALLIFLSAGTLGIMAAQLTAVGAAILAAGVAAYQAAFTEIVWDDFQCWVFCNMSDDLSISPDQVAAIIQKIDDNLAGLAHLGLLAAVQVAGAVGLTNMARSNDGDPDADCTGCTDCPDCHPDTFDAAIWASGIRTPVGTVEEVGTDFITIRSYDRGDGQQTMFISAIDGLTCCKFTIEFIGDVPGSVLHSYNACGEHANYYTLIPDDTDPYSHSSPMFGLQMDPNSSGWVVKWTFVS